jgi:hypothetical protein
MSRAGIRAWARPRSKYHAVKTVVDGITFDSKKEAARYGELKLLEKSKLIRHLLIQPKFILYVHDMTVASKLKWAARVSVPPVKVGTYVADFQYEELGLPTSENDHWFRVVEDVKGFKTPLYRWKKRHVEAQYGIVIREI